MHHTLYSFRRCPYAMRARMALAIAKIPYEKIEVSLKNKPIELLQISPKATVPVLVLQDGAVIDESLGIMCWALQQHDPLGWLNYQNNDLITKNDTEFKANLDRYKYPTRYPDLINHNYVLENIKSFLQVLELMLNNTKYLVANTLSITDIAIFPFVRQFHRIDEQVIKDFRYDKLIAWLDELSTSALFVAIMKK